MACLLYCVTLVSPDTPPQLTGVADQPVAVQESLGLRLCWSDVANPETLLEGHTRKIAEQKFRQVLRESASSTTTIALPFPALVEAPEAIEAYVVEHREAYVEALTRLAGMVQYELTATWADDERTDLATPVSGREYLKRRQETEARAAAIDQKLKTVTADIVREWRWRQERRTRIWYALIARGDRELFIAALRNAGSSEGVRLRLSGPWPPNEFAATQAGTE